MDETKCACGKIKTLMNLTNLNRHLKACKLKNLKKSAGKTQDIKSFFLLHLSKYLLYNLYFYSSIYTILLCF